MVIRAYMGLPGLFVIVINTSLNFQHTFKHDGLCFLAHICSCVCASVYNYIYIYIYIIIICNGGQWVGAVQVNLTPQISGEALAVADTSGCNL